MGDPLVGPILFFVAGSTCTLIAVGAIGGVGYLVYKNKNQAATMPVGDIPKHPPLVAPSPEPASTTADEESLIDEQPPVTSAESSSSEAAVNDISNPISEELLIEAERELSQEEEVAPEEEQDTDFDIEDALIPDSQSSEEDLDPTSFSGTSFSDPAIKESSTVSSFQDELGIPKLDVDDIAQETFPQPPEEPAHPEQEFVPEGSEPTSDEEVGEDDATVLMFRNPPQTKD